MTAFGPDGLDAMLGIAREAAALILRVYDAHDYVVEMKSPNDPVTVADRDANALLCDRLAREFPGVPVVAEESPPEAFAGFEASPRAFFVDPLDGTAEFVKRNGEFAVMVGLAEGGRPVAGVVVCPVGGRAFAGLVGRGAFEIDAAGARRAIAVSEVESLGDARCVVSRSHRGPEVDAALARLACKELVPCGSAGIKAVRVATGEADLYAHPARAGMRWDTCAPEAIVLAAGGTLVQVSGRPYDYRSRELANDGGAICANAALAARAILALGAGR